MKIASFAGVVALVAAAASAAGARAESITYTIFKDADPIGHDAYVITVAGDEKTVHVETDTVAHVLFISYHYHHTRTEVWKGDRILSFVSDTNDNGTKHHIEAHQDDGRLVGMVDGARKSMPGNAIPFTLWTRDYLTPNTPLFDIADFATLKLNFTDKGSDTLTVAGHPMPTHHYQVSGDLQWELWYGEDGGLVKTLFKRMGYPITFLRE